ncbi:MAG: hypothetical protein AABZ47_02970 [Planctomycetota bacterium]
MRGVFLLKLDGCARNSLRALLRRLFLWLGLGVIVFSGASCRIGEAVTDGIYGSISTGVSTVLLELLTGAAGVSP